MGDVFEAERIGPAGFRKPVALKQLALDHAVDGKAVERFFQEARISAQLRHANIVAVHDLLVDGNGHFIVMELLGGATLAELSRRHGGPLPWWLALGIAEQALAGLAYAHALHGADGRPLGLVHRDLTPRNLFVCADGTVKILDFGIAKLRHAATAGLTQEGHIAGTLAYVAPEQARGASVDARTDLYLLAAALYHAIAGEPPHGAGSPAEIHARALAEAVAPIATLRPEVPEAARAVIERALAFAPAERFPDAAAMREAVRAALAGAPPHDEAALARFVAELPAPLAIDPEPPPASLAPPGAVPSTLALGSTAPAPPPARARRGRRWAWAGAVAGVAGALAAGAWLGRFGVSAPPAPAPAAPAEAPHWTRVTFSRGTTFAARFHSGGARVVYGASWGGAPLRLHEGVPGQADHHAIRYPGEQLLAASPKGDVLVLLGAKSVFGVSEGVMASGTLEGALPRELLDHVVSADFGGGSIAVARWEEQRATVEYPPGQVQHALTEGWINHVRVAPDGAHVAFLVHPRVFDDAGQVVVVDREGHARELAKGYMSAAGLAWSPRGDEIWFTASREGASRQLRAVTLDGRERVVADVPGNLRLEDIAADGRVLASQMVIELKASVGGRDRPERDVSIFDATYAVAFDAKGDSLLLAEGGGDAAGEYGVYVRNLDGSPPKRLAQGHPVALSGDGKRALVLSPAGDRLSLVPTGLGAMKDIAVPGAKAYHWAAFFPDGERLLVDSSDARGQRGVSILDLERGVATPLGRPGMRLTRGTPLDRDGTVAALLDPADDRLYLVPTAGGEPAPIPSTSPGDSALAFKDSGRLYVAKLNTAPVVVHRVNPQDGADVEWKTLMPADPAGVRAVTHVIVTPDGDPYAYGYVRELGTLYVASGLR